MNSKKYLSIGVTLTLVFSLFFVGFSAQDENLAEKQELVIGMSYSDMGQLDPHMTSATNDVMILGSLFNGLVRYKPGASNPEKVQPDLAKGWEKSEDGLEWFFHLRQGVMFHSFNDHPAYELTSEDVVFSLKRAADPERSLFASQYNAFKSIEAVDKYTVRIKLSEPIPSVLGVLTDYHGGIIVSKKAVKTLGDNFKRHPVGTGPFKFKSYSPQQKVVLVRNENYFRGKPFIKKLEYRYMPDLRSRQAAYLKGEIDAIEGRREQAWLDEMAKKKDTKIDIFGQGEMRAVHFNMTREPLDDIKVRKAIAYATSRKLLMKVQGEGLTVASPSPVPPGYLGYIEEVKKYQYDLEKAKELLKEAGYPDGVSLGEMVLSDIASYKVPMTSLQEQWRAAGIDVKLRIVDHSTYHSQIRKDVNPVVFYGASRFPIADIYLTQWYHSDSIVDKETGITNFSHYGEVDADGDGEVDSVDKLIEKARSEANREKQLELWAEAQKQIMEDVPAYPLFVLRLVFARKPWVKLGYDLQSTMELGYPIQWNTRILAH